MKLHCTISDGSEFDIQLIEHPFVHEWTQSVVNFELLPTELTGIIGIGRKDPEYFIACLNYLSDLVDTVISLGFKVPIELIEPLPQYKDGGAIIQQWANNIHRWSVSNQNLLDAKSNIGKILIKINAAVHAFENTYEKPGQKTMQGNDKHYWDQGLNLQDPDCYIRNGNFIDEIKDLLTNDYYTVWVAKRILGKDWRECYMDQDDPTEIDIVNMDKHIQYAFEIDLNDWRQFYYGENFLNWLAKYNIEYDVTKMGRIPLGNVLIEHEELQQKINNNETITILQIC